MKLEPRISKTTVSFIGDEVHKTLNQHFDMLKAVWGLCSGMTDATIECHVSPRLADATPVMWNVYISSPAGHRSIVATQRRPAAAVTFSNE